MQKNGLGHFFLNLQLIFFEYFSFFSCEHANSEMVEHVFLRCVVPKFVTFRFIAQWRLNIKKRALPYWNSHILSQKNGTLLELLSSKTENPVHFLHHPLLIQCKFKQSQTDDEGQRSHISHVSIFLDPIVDRCVIVERETDCNFHTKREIGSSHLWENGVHWSGALRIFFRVALGGNHAVSFAKMRTAS